MLIGRDDIVEVGGRGAAATPTLFRHRSPEALLTSNARVVALISWGVVTTCAGGGERRDWMGYDSTDRTTVPVRVVGAPPPDMGRRGILMPSDVCLLGII